MHQHDHIKHRDMMMQVVLFLCTFGIYGLYWFYVTLKELHQDNGRDEWAGWWTGLLIIPIVNFFALWHHAHQYAQFVGGKYSGVAIFILWLVFFPAAWLLVQHDLNRAASYYRN